jgi:tripartite-type tricarboxylate transporter receptor subunit TctC
MEYLKLATGMDIQHVPYKGTGPMVIDLVAGRTQIGVAGTPPLLQHVKAGKLRAVAVGTPNRIAVLPEVRSVAEQGYPGFETSQWYGLIGPAKLPEPVVRKLADEAAKAMRSKAVLDRLAVESAIPVGSTPQEFAQFIATEQARWKEVIQNANIRPD